jgi:hypothetical protein
MIASQTISTGARPFAGTRVASKFARNGSRVCMKAGNWLPGSDTPAYLENLPASYGFGELLTSRKGREVGGAWLKSQRVCSDSGRSEFFLFQLERGCYFACTVLTPGAV